MAVEGNYVELVKSEQVETLESIELHQTSVVDGFADSVR
jgi:hypothetical protein